MLSYNGILVSIIVPIYKVEKYLRHCVDSIRRQTHQNIEIILVDDGSSDNCSQICDEYAKLDSRIVVIHQENQGSGLARNAGIDIARGEWICFVDSDDYVNPLFVERLLKIAIDNDCLTVQCCFQRVGEGVVKADSSPPEIKIMDWRNYFIYVFSDSCGEGIGSRGHTPFGPVVNIYHITLFSHIRFCSLRLSEDIEFIPRIIHAAGIKPIAITNEVLYYYYQRDGSLSKSEASLDLIDKFYALKCAVDFFEEKGEREIYNLFYNTFFDCMVKDYLDICARMPCEQERFSFLRTEIQENLDQACAYCHEQTVFRPDAKRVWETISKPGNDFILYGYGNCGKEYLYWLKFFGVNIVEVWDQKAVVSDCIESIPFRRAHYEADKNVIILIAIKDFHVSLGVQQLLRKLGYKNFLMCQTLESGLKYGKFKRFLPFMIENYGGLLHE